jgi:hypothetical protein
LIFYNFIYSINLLPWDIALMEHIVLPHLVAHLIIVMVIPFTPVHALHIPQQPLQLQPAVVAVQVVPLVELWVESS